MNTMHLAHDTTRRPDSVALMMCTGCPLHYYISQCTLDALTLFREIQGKDDAALMQHRGCGGKISIEPIEDDAATTMPLTDEPDSLYLDHIDHRSVQ